MNPVEEARKLLLSKINLHGELHMNKEETLALLVWLNFLDQQLTIQTDTTERIRSIIADAASRAGLPAKRD